MEESLKKEVLEGLLTLVIKSTRPEILILMLFDRLFNQQFLRNWKKKMPSQILTQWIFSWILVERKEVLALPICRCQFGQAFSKVRKGNNPNTRWQQFMPNTPKYLSPLWFCNLVWKWNRNVIFLKFEKCCHFLA